MHPGEVPRGARVVLATEVCVDVQVGVRKQAEVGVPVAVEQELVAVIAADEARVIALRAGKLTHCSNHSRERDTHRKHKLIKIH